MVGIEKGQPGKAEIAEFINIVKQLNSTSFALMQNNANILLARDKLESAHKTHDKTIG